jgi:hypothetical protein
MADWCVIRVIGPSHAEGNRTLYLVREQLEISPREFVDEPVSHYRGIAARDVVSDTGDRHLIPVCGYTAYRHQVAHVPVGHERRVGRARRDLLELRDRFFIVRAENGRDTPNLADDVSHALIFLRFPRQRTLILSWLSGGSGQ